MNPSKPSMHNLRGILVIDENALCSSRSRILGSSVATRRTHYPTPFGSLCSSMPRLHDALVVDFEPDGTAKTGTLCHGQLSLRSAATWQMCRVSSTPGWWVSLYMNRPKRRENRRLCREIVAGTVPESMAFPLGNRRPHVYYW